MIRALAPNKAQIRTPYRQVSPVFGGSDYVFLAQHFFNRVAEKILERVLNVLGRLNRV
jgi:hypothetical protein